MATPVEISRLGPHETVLNCRFYEKKYPDIEELVMVRVKTISETAAYVQLLEYNAVEGMIPLSELSRRRIRSVNKHIRVGKTEIVQVMRVDTEKGYIDLSKKKVNDDDIKPCELRYNKAKDVHSIMKHVAEECKCSLESLYQAVAWPLYAKYGHAFDAFNMAVANPEKILDPLNLPADVREKLFYNIKHRHKAQPFRVRADIEVTCFTYEGIDAIRAALKQGEATFKENEEINISIRLLAAPAYVLIASALDKDAGIELMAKAIRVMKAALEAAGGNLKETKPPRVVSNAEEQHVKEEDDDDEEEEDEEEEDEESGDEGGKGDDAEEEEEEDDK
eukprot:TRINITY_DN546_c0_g1_i1.p1 TRINITY_DN546_c0_g1~~TRINITY_DN546_c0_g1_i1.p1  ORF type:complete len:334 (-),score=90.15 TRINITY_DN546_c0_g1_i1:102-1103(-)